MSSEACFGDSVSVGMRRASPRLASSGSKACLTSSPARRAPSPASRRRPLHVPIRLVTAGRRPAGSVRATAHGADSAQPCRSGSRARNRNRPRRGLRPLHCRDRAIHGRGLRRPRFHRSARPTGASQRLHARRVARPRPQPHPGMTQPIGFARRTSTASRSSSAARSRRRRQGSTPARSILSTTRPSPRRRRWSR